MIIDTPKATVNNADIGYVKVMTDESAVVIIDSSHHNNLVELAPLINGDITLSSSAAIGTKVILFNPDTTEVPFLSTTFVNNNPAQVSGKTVMIVVKVASGWCVVSIL